MDNRYGYPDLVKLAFLKLIISFILFIINLVLILFINNAVFLDDMIFRGLFVFLFGFEGLRIIIMLMCGVLTLRVKKMDRKLKVAIVAVLLFGIGFNILYIVRLFGFACFTPIYSFLCMVLISFSFVLIIIQDHENN